MDHFALNFLVWVAFCKLLCNYFSLGKKTTFTYEVHLWSPLVTLPQSTFLVPNMGRDLMAAPLINDAKYAYVIFYKIFIEMKIKKLQKEKSHTPKVTPDLRVPAASSLNLDEPISISPLLSSSLPRNNLHTHLGFCPSFSVTHSFGKWSLASHAWGRSLFPQVCLSCQSLTSLSVDAFQRSVTYKANLTLELPRLSQYQLLFHLSCHDHHAPRLHFTLHSLIICWNKSENQFTLEDTEILQWTSVNLLWPSEARYC